MSRSLLFAPADSAHKLAKAFTSGADAVIVDLEDSVAPSAKSAARANARAFLAEVADAPERPRIHLRVNALESGLIEEDLDCFGAHPPDAVVLPKARGGADVQRLAAKLAVREALNGVADGAVAIVAIATESGAAMFGLSTYAGASRRLLALTWGAEDLSADLGAQANRSRDGVLTDPYRLARALLLYGAADAGVEAIDAIYALVGDESGLRTECEAAARDGFVGKLAIHPAQIAIINEVFAVSAQAQERARKIIEAFAASPDKGALQLEGEMIDRPHLTRAERLLRRAARDRRETT